MCQAHNSFFNAPGRLVAIVVCVFGALVYGFVAMTAPEQPKNAQSSNRTVVLTDLDEEVQICMVWTGAGHKIETGRQASFRELREFCEWPEQRARWRRSAGLGEPESFQDRFGSFQRAPGGGIMPVR
jgi:hypothetical protein